MKTTITKILLIFAFAMTAQVSSAQLLKIFKADGTVLYFNNAEVDSIVVTDKHKIDETPKEAVDLGLSVKWATCNIGANSPEEYGDYFVWGETSPKEYIDESYALIQSTDDVCNSNGNIKPEFDAATVNLGDSWRIPTVGETEELINMCDWAWTFQNGTAGYLVTSKTNGNSIFLPAAGYKKGSTIFDDSYSSQPTGRYNISTRNNKGFMEGLVFNQNSHNKGAYSLYQLQLFGLSIRPVTK